jgi:hypothetical protein
MNDRRKHRGAGPEDKKLFSQANVNKLRRACGDLSLLVSRGYAEKSSVKLVGDRFDLTSRQRLAIVRASCSDQQLRTRRNKQVLQGHLTGLSVAVDGYNILITLESALSGAPLFVCRDSVIRDLAGIHGTYRRVEETAGAMELAAEVFEAAGVGHVQWYFDSPVSNSGRLKTAMYEFAVESGLAWDIELVNNPDKVLADCEEVVISGDSDVLDKCSCWFNFSFEAISSIQSCWLVDLRSD